MTNWTHVPAFGSPPENGQATVRPSAYAVVADDADRIATVHTPQGVFLPGGGIEPGEDARDAVLREVLEECGLDVQLGSWSVRAIDFVYSFTELQHFEKRAVFLDARPTGRRVTPTETDHELVWMTVAEAVARLTHPSHRWAVEQRDL